MSSLPRVPMHISDRILSELVDFGRERYPTEACGMLLPEPWKGSQVIELPNRSLEGHDSYTIWPDDVELALGEWAHSVDQFAREAVGVWHTHPSGLIGPSRRDMRTRLAGVAYLVVSLGEKPTPVWF